MQFSGCSVTTMICKLEPFLQATQDKHIRGTLFDPSLTLRKRKKDVSGKLPVESPTHATLVSDRETRLTMDKMTKGSGQKRIPEDEVAADLRILLAHSHRAQRAMCGDSSDL
ncbi:uncharacterized protein LOC144115646 [Amblyomma americanum]